MAELLPNFRVLNSIRSTHENPTKPGMLQNFESLNLRVFHFLNGSINLIKDPHHRPSEACRGLCGPKPGAHGMLSCGRDPCVYPIQLRGMLRQSQGPWLIALYELFEHLPCLLLLIGPDVWVMTLGHTKRLTPFILAIFSKYVPRRYTAE